MSGSALVVTHLSKKLSRDFRRAQWYGLRDIGRELAGRGGTLRPELRAGEFWALDDVSFQVRRGESLGVIGANGAGKSTLLKVLYGLVKPDGGEVTVAGRVGALIELGTGFDAALSGRENVRVNAALHGLSRRRTLAVMDRIEEFAGLADSMDVPLQYYSSGMQARLAFAVAAHLEPDVLLVDEVLAVGDLAYQRKCISHMQSYLDAGGALVFVSHSAHQLQAICQTGVLLERGRLTYAGTAVDTLALHLEKQAESGASPARAAPPGDASPVSIESLAVQEMGGGEIHTGDAVRVTLGYRARERTTVRWGFSIWTADQWVCATGGTDPRERTLEPGAGELHCVIPRIPLVAGTYGVRASLLDPSTTTLLDRVGWQNAPHVLRVRPRPTRESNAAMAMQQVVTIDIEWE